MITDEELMMLEGKVRAAAKMQGISEIRAALLVGMEVAYEDAEWLIRRKHDVAHYAVAGALESVTNAQRQCRSIVNVRL